MVVVTLLGMLAPAAAQEPSGEISFGFWGDPAEASAYEAIVAAFEEQNPGIDVQIEYVPNATDFYTRLATGYAAGLAPDVFLINYRRYGQFAARDALVPVGPLAGSERGPGRGGLLSASRWRRSGSTAS